MAYMDIIHQVRQISDRPVAVYNVSGEYAMVKAAGEKGWLDADAVLLESVQAIHRAGASIVITYAAKDIAKRL